MKAPLLPSDSTLMGNLHAGPRLCPHAFLVCGQYQLHLVVKHGSSELYHGIKSEGTHTNIYRKMNKRSIEGCRGKVTLFSNSQVRSGWLEIQTFDFPLKDRDPVTNLNTTSDCYLDLILDIWDAGAQRLITNRRYLGCHREGFWALSQCVWAKESCRQGQLLKIFRMMLPRKGQMKRSPESHETEGR